MVTTNNPTSASQPHHSLQTGFGATVDRPIRYGIRRMYGREADERAALSVRRDP